VIPVSSTWSIEVARKERLRPALVGGSIGAVLGYPAYRNIFNCIDVSNNPSGGCHKAQTSGVVGSIAGLAILGAGIGAIIGTERWERIPIWPVVAWTGWRPR
jgi:hypothetical protein